MFHFQKILPAAPTAIQLHGKFAGSSKTERMMITVHGSRFSVFGPVLTILILLTQCPLWSQWQTSGNTISTQTATPNVSIAGNLDVPAGYGSIPLTLHGFGGWAKLQVNNVGGNYTANFGFTEAVANHLGVSSDGAIVVKPGNTALATFGYNGGGVGLGAGYAATTPPANGVIIEGKVGIGTTDPGGYKLAVKGTIAAGELIVTNTTGWADYVFASDYHLPALSEVASYVQKNHHLSGIPSAEEVAQNGIGVGEMQSRLLVKIEELTLQMIQADRSIRSLVQENQGLQKKVTELQKRRSK